MTVKKSIHFLISGLYVGGAEKQLQMLVMNMPKDKYNLKVITLISDIGQIGGELRDAGIEVVSLGYSSIKDFPKAFFRLRRILKQDMPDILHCWMFHANMIGRFATFGLKIKNISSVRERYHSVFMLLIEALSSVFVDRYITNSDVMKQQLGFDEKVTVINNGVEEKFFDEEKKTVLRREDIGIYDDLPIIVMVANPRKQKDYPTMLRAILMVSEYKNIHFVIVGGGTQFHDETENIKMLAKSLAIYDNTHFLGYRDDVRDILSISDIWVSSTLYEGKSNTLIEAMAMGMPIVTTDIPENREVVENGMNALLVPCGDKKLMSEAILLLLNNSPLPMMLGVYARHTAKIRFSVKKMVKETEKGYEGME